VGLLTGISPLGSGPESYGSGPLLIETNLVCGCAVHSGSLRFAEMTPGPMAPGPATAMGAVGRGRGRRGLCRTGL